MNNEIWKEIPGYENYQVSNLGNIRNVQTGKILKLKADRDGYLFISLFKHGKSKNFRIHRLVFETFISKIPAELEINHIDLNKQNPRLDNLELVTHSENMVHAYQNGIIRPTGERNGQAKLTKGKVRTIRSIAKNTNKTGKEIARIFHVDPSLITLILQGKIWKF